MAQDGWTRIGIGFKPEDVEQLNKLQGYIEKEQGTVSLAAALRVAIREAVARRAKKHGEI